MKEAVFYCESCSRPVPLDAEICPHCGSRFTAVQCPKCSFVGEAPQFATGCPQCGYLAPEVRRTRVRPAPAASATGQAPPAQTIRREQPPRPKRGFRSQSRLPPWFYSFASLLLLLVLAGLIMLLLRQR